MENTQRHKKETREFLVFASVLTAMLLGSFGLFVIFADAAARGGPVMEQELLEALKALLDIAPFAKNEGDKIIHEQAAVAIRNAERKL